MQLPLNAQKGAQEAGRAALWVHWRQGLISGAPGPSRHSSPIGKLDQWTHKPWAINPHFLAILAASSGLPAFPPPCSSVGYT